MSRWVWICPEEKGGIRSYSDALWGALVSAAPAGSEILFTSDPNKIAALNPSLIHVQHEYGCFGSKVPGLYFFPGWVREMRRLLPEAKLVATAHTVIPNGYKYPVHDRGWQVPLRLGANLTLMPLLNRWWNRSTWRALDAVVVHSRLQLQTVLDSGCPMVREIAHFVPEVELSIGSSFDSVDSLLVFGFVSPEKGQDVVIRAMSKLPSSLRLQIVGGVRRTQDQGYYKQCETLVRELGLEGRVTFSGFADNTKLDRIYADAQVVIAPFRETTGSGSLVQALARGKAVLASDLPLNREIADRVRESLALFRSEDPEDCARQIGRLLGDASVREGHRHAALEYAKKYSLEETAKAHIGLYGDLEVL